MRARAYINTIEGAVSGDGGHGKTFRVACILVSGFGLDKEQAFNLLREYNDRCEPPWSEAELRHKVEDAAKQIGRSGVSIDRSIEARKLKAALPPNLCGSQPSLKVVRLSEIQSEDVQPLWPGRIYRGKLNLIVGHPGLGKSFVSHYLAAMVTVGGEVPFGGGERFPKGDVLLFAAEDGPADTIRPRLEKCGADVDRVHWVAGVSTVNADGTPAERIARFDTDILTIRRFLEERSAGGNPIALLIVDTLDSYLGHCDSWKSQEVRGVLIPLVNLASEYDIAVLGISHLNKAGGGPAVTRSLGSMAFVGLARTVWLVGVAPGDDGNQTKTSSERLFVQVKNNLSAAQPGLVFEITDGGLAWLRETEITADEALASGHRKSRDRSSALDEMTDWLEEHLGDGKPRLSREVQDDAVNAGHSLATFQRGCRRLALVREKLRGSGQWTVRLPVTQDDRNGSLEDVEQDEQVVSLSTTM